MPSRGGKPRRRPLSWLAAVVPLLVGSCARGAVERTPIPVATVQVAALPDGREQDVDPDEPLSVRDPESKSRSTALPGIEIVEIAVGSGPAAQPGDELEVHYVGWVANGEQIDSSYDRSRPFKFTLGAHMVIAGWDEGLVGMKIGGTRRLTISPEKAYGSHGAGDKVPANATLVFEVKLLGIEGN